jgi:hypothetical protein
MIADRDGMVDGIGKDDVRKGDALAYEEGVRLQVLLQQPEGGKLDVGLMRVKLEMYRAHRLMVG